MRKIHYYSLNIPFFGLLNARGFFSVVVVAMNLFSNDPPLGVYLQTGQLSKCLFQIKEKLITLYKGSISTRFPLFVPHNRMYSNLLTFPPPPHLQGKSPGNEVECKRSFSLFSAQIKLKKPHKLAVINHTIDSADAVIKPNDVLLCIHGEVLSFM